MIVSFWLQWFLSGCAGYCMTVVVIVWQWLLSCCGYCLAVDVYSVLSGCGGHCLSAYACGYSLAVVNFVAFLLIYLLCDNLYLYFQ